MPCPLDLFSMILGHITIITLFFFCYFFSFDNPHICVDKPNQRQRLIIKLSGLTTQAMIKSAAGFFP